MHGALRFASRTLQKSQIHKLSSRGMEYQVTWSQTRVDVQCYLDEDSRIF